MLENLQIKSYKIIDNINLVTLWMVEGDRPCGRRAKRWSDDTVEWCGCSLPEAVQLTSDRGGRNSMASMD